MSLMFIFALVAPIQATVPVVAPPAPAVAPPSDGEKLLCKRLPVVGSNIMGKNQCMTRRQWDEMAQKAQQFKRGTEQALTTRNQ